MSTDVVDDLHAAEDMAGCLGAAMERLLSMLPPPNTSSIRTDYGDALADARARLDEWRGYCRPSCQFLEEGECQDADPDCCGCPCQHEPVGS